MPLFDYRATDRTGKEFRGKIEANNEQTVIERLRGMGYYPSEVKKVKSKSAGGIVLEDLPGIKQILWFIFRGTVTTKTLTPFTRQLATLIGAGFPLRKSLDVLTEQTQSSNLKTALFQISADIESGANFSEALAKHPRVFNKLFVAMIKAGEISGAMEQVLVRLSVFAEKREAVIRKVKSAMIYPIIVMLLAGVIVTVILIVVVPAFEGIYGDMGAELPAMTQLLVDASNIIQTKALWVVACIVGFVVLIWRINCTTMGRNFFDVCKVNAPAFGVIIQKALIARFARTFGTLLDTGVPILQSILIVRDTAGNNVLARAMIDVHNSIRDGDTVSEPMHNHKIFPPLVCHMVAVGEETGAIDAMLVKVAETYEQEVEASVDALTSIIEPLLIVCLGFIIGFIVIALYLPMFNIGDVIG